MTSSNSHVCLARYNQIWSTGQNKYIQALRSPAHVVWLTNYLLHLHKATATPWPSSSVSRLQTITRSFVFPEHWRLGAYSWALLLWKWFALLRTPAVRLSLVFLNSFSAQQSGPEHKCSFYNTISNSAEMSSSLQSWHVLSDNSQPHSAVIYLRS